MTHTIPTYPEPPWLTTLRADLDAALTRLAAVTALAAAADARPPTCATRGLVSSRAIRAAISETTEGER